MGRGHARAMKNVPDIELVAICDLQRDLAEQTAAESAPDARIFTDYAQMLAEVKPDIVAIATPNMLHAPHLQEALAAGAKGIYCEKPMAVNMADARGMVEGCRERGVPLVINHQRRMGADLVEARRLIESGAIGKLRVIRGNCAGDFLSDGTHLVDSIMWLAGDAAAKWVTGFVHREINEEMRKQAEAQKQSGGRAGYRFGHPVENGATAVVQLENGVRVEFFTGDLREPYTCYQDYEVVGMQGRLWRTGDGFWPNLFIADRDGGPLTANVDVWQLTAMPAPEGTKGEWRAVELPTEKIDQMTTSYARFAETMRKPGTPHPMSGENALRGFEIIMAIYESARVHHKIELPLKQDKFPLVAMMEEMGQKE
jgi:predicted dehydrogenase